MTHTGFEILESELWDEADAIQRVVARKPETLVPTRTANHNLLNGFAEVEGLRNHGRQESMQSPRLRNTRCRIRGTRRGMVGRRRLQEDSE